MKGVFVGSIYLPYIAYFIMSHHGLRFIDSYVHMSSLPISHWLVLAKFQNHLPIKL